MAGILSHTYSLTQTDATTTGIVHAADWNAGHAIGNGTQAYGLVPIGGVIIWAGLIANVPSGFALCDGSSLLRAGTYADLFAQVGTVFGYADGTHFNLPDLRDKFVVGARQDDSGAPKTNIRGSLEQSITVTGAVLTHSLTIADHTGLTHGVTIGQHPDLTHNALALADHPSLSLSGAAASVTGTVTARTSTASTALAQPASHTHVATVTAAAITHNVSVQAGTHMGTAYGTHAVTAPTAHGTAGTVTHSFTPPADHTASVVPAFVAMAYIIRYF